MLEIRVLGDVSVIRDGVVQPIARGLVRIALLSLVVNLDRVVADEVLTERLWGDVAPRTAAYSLRNAVSRLRGALGDTAVVRSAGGYRLRADAAVVDAVEFEQRLARARAIGTSQPAAALVELDAALGLVRGMAYAEVRDEEWAVATARGADDMVAAAEEAWTEMRLRLGADSTHLWRIRSFATAQPMRERRWCQLVDALSRDARRAEALRAVQDARVALAEYGLEPGPELFAAERRALQLEGGDGRPDEIDSSEARMRAALSLQRAGAFDEARALLDEAAALAAQHGGRRSAARVMVERARLCMLSGDGDPRPLLDEARSIGRELRDGSLLSAAALVGFAAGLSPQKSTALVELLEPLPLLSPIASESIDLLCAAAVTVAFADGSPAARQLLTEAMRVHEQQGTERSEALLAVTQAMVDAVDGRPHRQVSAAAERALELASGADDHVLTVLASMAALRAAYQCGDLRAIEQLLPSLDHSSRLAMLPFGTMRVALCRTSNAIARGDLEGAMTAVAHEQEIGNRFRTLVTETAVRTHRFLLAQEADRMADLIPVARVAQASRPGPNAWDAVLAIAGDSDSAVGLATAAPLVVPDDTYDVFLSLSAEVAARRHDAPLGRWCAERLEPMGERTVMSGIGTAVLGFSKHYLGLAHVAEGDLRRARTQLAQAADAAARTEAWLWWAHSQVELADVEGLLGNLQAADDALGAVARSSVVEASPRLTRRVAEVAARHSLRPKVVSAS